MDIDLSKVVLIILAVLPGYLALRGSDRVIPRTQRKKGATEEVAEFLIFSVLAHSVVAVLCILFWMLAGLLCKHSALFFLHGWLQPAPAELLRKLGGIPAGYLAIYFFLALGIGWLLGLGRGLFDAWRPIEQVARKLGILDTPIGHFWSKYVERFLITGRPIIYDALFPDLDEDGDPKQVFAEIVLKEHQGTITGRVASFSIANDEECHKLIYLEDVYQTKPGSSIYKKIDADGLLVDIADAITLQIKQV
jgi:hypothetical protein